MSANDTIAAIATPTGRGGIGIVRVSGKRSKEIAAAILGIELQPRRATARAFTDSLGRHIDFGLALLFEAPLSFTGEDVLELHGHGGPVILDMLLARVLELGARLAEAGEFSQRAFLNEKLDLSQAEAIADLIDSGSEQAARAAMRSLQGEFSKRADILTRMLVDARMHVEAAIDFPEEEVDFLADQVLHQRLGTLQSEIDSTIATAEQGVLLRNGMTVVIAGKPNAGKSSLLNALAGYEAAIVTPIPGTTRDVLRENILIDGMPLHVIDTAGLRETQDLVESEGIRRAHEEMNRADRILYVMDGNRSLSDSELRTELARLPSNVAVTIILSKCDLGLSSFDARDQTTLALSSTTGAGLAELRLHLKAIAGFQEASTSTFSARRRHLDALRRARQRIATAVDLLRLRKAGELMAEELRLAQLDVGEITGEVTSDDLLGEIFSSFCIGK